MEQVYNFSTTGDLEGSQYNYWVEVKACIFQIKRGLIIEKSI